MKLVTVIGARPQFIKAAAVSEVARSSGVTEALVHTGQHYDENMSDVFFEELQIPKPAYHLGVGSGTHGAQTGRMLGAIEQVLMAEMPDWVLVYGDTNSTLAGAVAAAKMHIPVAHVEAGLRSFNRRMPEEINRVLTDHCSDILFAPTEAAVENLAREGIAQASVHLVGDVMYDVALRFGKLASAQSSIIHRLSLTPKQYVLATIHRAENTDSPERLKAILRGLATLAEELPVVLPMHPRTRAAIDRAQLTKEVDGIQVIPPVGYIDMVRLEMEASCIATDSGGVQKEAYFHGVPCVTLRDETEWVELVSAGWNRLAPPIDSNDVTREIRAAMNSRPKERPAFYGAGDSARKIVDRLRQA